ncbi:MAG: EamA family transporter [Candidatus Limnocylindrales bacterium]
MTAILGGLGAAVMWATSTLTSSRSSRIIGPSSTAAWMMLIGLVCAVPLAAVSGPMPALTPALAGWLAGSGVGGVAGLLLTYKGLRVGKAGVVSALASTEGAIAAVLAVIAGEHLTIPVMAMLCVIAGGIATVALATGDAAQPADASSGRDERRAVMFGVAAALCFGVTIFSTAQVGKVMTPFAATLPVRVVGVAAVFVPMALAGRLQMTRRAVPMVVVIGVAEVLGNAAFVVGSRESIAISAVLASQFAALTAVAAFILFRERLSPQQRFGIVAIVLGVAALTVVRG